MKEEKSGGQGYHHSQSGYQDHQHPQSYHRNNTLESTCRVDINHHFAIKLGRVNVGEYSQNKGHLVLTRDMMYKSTVSWSYNLEV